ncbi:MAG: hypothetical protein CMN31_01960 [Sandaracinus sp.]|nr:hypothetical protein [Sandaracinus sp.]MBJ70128.1 hypothetical protein [Sandaracinus sp.]
MADAAATGAVGTAAAERGLDARAWALAALAVLMTLAPLWLRRLAREEVPGARRVGTLGVVFGVALAAAIEPTRLSLLRELTLQIMLPLAGALLVDLALRVPDELPAAKRSRPLLILLTGVAILVGGVASLPPFHLAGELILAPPRLLQVAPLAGLGALGLSLAVRTLRRRFGSTPEALASNAWAVLGLTPAFAAGVAVLALAELGRLEGRGGWALLTVAAGGAVALFGHTALVDPRRRPRAGRAVRGWVAHGLTALGLGAAAFALHDQLPHDPISFTVAMVLAWIAAMLLWTGMRRATHRLLAPYGGRLLDAIGAARRELVRATSLEELAERVLVPLREASGDPMATPQLWTVDPGRAADVDAAANPRSRPQGFPGFLLAHLEATPGAVVVTRDVDAKVVRQPELRPLGELLESHDALCAVPLVVHGEVEGALLVPRGRRGSALSLEEMEGLLQLGDEVAAMLALIVGRDRTQRRLGELARERDRLDERLDEAEAVREKLEREGAALRAGRGAGRRAAPPVAYSKAMRELEARLGDLAPTETPVTLLAEGGTPVDRVALRLHEASGRAGGPFVVADCAGLRPERAEAALFGDGEHPGWMRMAEGGTLLLADVPALPLATQHALAEALAVRQARSAEGKGPYPIDLRLVVTTRVPLGPLAELGRVDAELARWLDRAVVEVPPLRARAEDIPSLVLLALDRACRVLGKETVGIAQGALDALLAHDWPGNLRELQHAIDRAVARAEGEQVTRRDLPALARRHAPAAGDPLEGTYAEVERRVLERAMKKADGNKSEAARLLGLKRTTFLDKLRRQGLAPPPKKKGGKKKKDGEESAA